MKAFIDTRANGFCFILETLAIKLANFVGILMQCLRNLILVKGFNGSHSEFIIYCLRVHFMIMINKRKQLSISFFVIYLG